MHRAASRISASASRTRLAPSMISPRRSASARRPAAVSGLAATNSDNSSTTARAALGSSRAMASSARLRIFSTEARRASASNSRARMTISDSAAIAATPAASQPSQSARENRSRISRSVHRPSASVTSVPSAPRKIAPRRERRRGATAGGGSLVSMPMSLPPKTSISSGVTIATSDLASARGLRAVSAWRFCSDSRTGFASGCGSIRNAAGLRGSLMPAGLRSGTATRGRA